MSGKPFAERATAAKHYHALSGIEATRRVLAEAEREEFLSLWLLARAIGCTTKRLRRDWLARGHHITHVGHEDRVAARVAVAAYFPHVHAPRIDSPA